ncbi:MAG TPA: hypothetical protein VII06_00715 [Chloroflexota bacterium]|jgi:hypothetical protein
MPTQESGRTLTLEQALRTIGLGLEGTAERRATLTLDDGGILVKASAAYGTRRHTWSSLALDASILQEQRRHSRRSNARVDPWALRRWSVLLRATGRLLDSRRLYACDLEAQVAATDPPQEATVRVLVDGRQMCDTAAVGEHLLRLRLHAEGGQRGGPRTRAVEARPWWARWRNA